MSRYFLAPEIISSQTSCVFLISPLSSVVSVGMLSTSSIRPAGWASGSAEKKSNNIAMHNPFFIIGSSFQVMLNLSASLSDEDHLFGLGASSRIQPVEVNTAREVRCV